MRILLHPRQAQRNPLARLLNLLLGWFFKLFNKSFDWSAAGYTRLVGRLFADRAVVLLVYGGLLGLTWWSFNHVPAGFIPTQDKGYLFANLQLPDAASLERTEQTLARVDKICQQTPGIAHTIQISGMSLILGVNASNVATMIAILDPFEQRTAPDRSADAIMATLRRRFAREIQDGEMQVFGAPPVDGLGNASGFKLVLEDRGDSGFAALQEQADALARQAGGLPGVAAAFSMFRAEAPQLFVDIDRTKCKTLGVPLNDVFQTLQVNMGGLYINDINLFGRTWQVNVQADTPFRMRAEDLRQMQLRNTRGDMAPLGAMVDVKDSGGPFFVNRYNTYPASPINGVLLPGMSTGQAIASMNDLARRQLPASMAAEWTELSYLQVTAGNTTAFVFSGAVLLVFLVLAGQYESWTLPLAVIFVVPMCILCSVLGVAMAGMDNNIFTQIGFVVLVGLASKNAILIVEFAKAQREAGSPRYEATLAACRLRLRPILMTSFAFILGVLPLVLSQGAGSEMRRTLGVAVFSGMLGVTLFGILLTPVFYYVIQALGDRRRR